jgi:hypothetical protein
MAYDKQRLELRAVTDAMAGRFGLLRSNKAKDERLAEAKAAWQLKPVEHLSSLDVERHIETEGRLAATKAKREAEADDRLAAAEAEWQAEADRRLAEARGTWQREADERLTEAKATWQRKADERFASARAKWEQNALERLSSLGAEWKAEADNRLAVARAEWQAEADKDLAAARTEWSQQVARRPDAADTVQRASDEKGTASSIGGEFAELFAQQQGVEDQGPEAANAQQDPNGPDETAAGMKRMLGRTWMWGAAASVVLGLYFAPSLAPVLDTLESNFESKAPPVAEKEFFYVVTDVANIREKASTNSRIVSRVAFASKLTGVKRKGRWVKVIIDGGKEPVGWIHAFLLAPRKSQRR